MAWLTDPIGTLSLAQRLLVALRAAGAALRATDTACAADAGWELGDAALIARALADLSAQLPAVIATVNTAVDHAGTPVEVQVISTRCTTPSSWWPIPTGWPMTSIPIMGPMVDTPTITANPTLWVL